MQMKKAGTDVCLTVDRKGFSQRFKTVDLCFVAWLTGVTWEFLYEMAFLSWAVPEWHNIAGCLFSLLLLSSGFVFFFSLNWHVFKYFLKVTSVVFQLIIVLAGCVIWSCSMSSPCLQGPCSQQTLFHHLFRICLVAHKVVDRQLMVEFRILS